MDTLLLVLLLLVIAGGASATWWLRGRLRELEERLDEFAPLSLVPDRLQALARVIEHFDPDQVREELESIRDALQRVEDLVAVPVVVEEASPEPELPIRIRAAVQRHLREEGYEAINVLEEDQDLVSNPTKIRVECRRRGLRILGTVQVENERVVGVDLSPSYTMFP
ncbi:MAG: hypothetical protein H8E31_12665 [Planctomycetes bacterium]|nr:hypothetical protein [Planctomycetota bacterium]